MEGATTIPEPSPLSGGVHVAIYSSCDRIHRNIPVFSSGLKKGPTTFNVKVVQASLKWLPNGKPDFKQLFVDFTEATANVYYVQSVVQRK